MHLFERSSGATRRSGAGRGDTNHWPWLIVLGIISVAAVLSALGTTRHGPGLSPDSAVYVGTADNVAAGHGFVVPFHDYPLPIGRPQATTGPPQVVLTHFPPLYPAVLGAVAYVTSAATQTVARWIQVVAFGFLIGLVGVIVFVLSGRSPITAVIAAGLTAGAADLYNVHTTVLAEPMFLVLCLVGLVLLARYRTLPSAPRALAFSGVTAAALLVRFSAGALLLTGIVIMVTLQGSWVRRLGHSTITGLVAALPIAIWLATRTSTGGPRSVAFHPITLGDINEALVTTGGWLLPSGAPHALDALVVVAGLLALGSILAWARRRVQPAVGIFVVFPVAYAVFMVCSISFFDANVSPLSPRILAPAHLALLVAIPAIVRAAWPGRISITRPALVIAASIAALLLVQAGAWIGHGHDNTLGYAAAEWRRSPTIAAVRSLRPDALIYTNAPDALYLLADRASYALPESEDLVSQRFNHSLVRDEAAVAAQLRARHGVIVYLRLSYRQFVPTPSGLKEAMGLRTLASLGDGLLLTPRPQMTG